MAAGRLPDGAGPSQLQRSHPQAVGDVAPHADSASDARLWQRVGQRSVPAEFSCA